MQPKLNHRALSARIKDRNAQIGIIGMGYVGLPLMLASTEKGFRVLGFDIDEKKSEGSILAKAHLSMSAIAASPPCAKPNRSRQRTT